MLINLNFIKVLFISIICSVLLCACEGSPSELHDRVEQLEERLQNQEDIEAIRRVTYSYGYFMDNALIQEVVDLFSTDMEYCEISGYGLYKGRKGCEIIWRDIIGPGLQNSEGQRRFGVLVKHYLLKDVITVSENGDTAQGRFDYIGFSGAFKVPDRALNQLGVYRIGFVKEDGLWKINRFSLSFDTSDFNDNNWTTKPGIRCPRDGVPAPDGGHLFYHPFPETGVIPFHYSHPVTGEPLPENVNPLRYWQGNGEGEFETECGKRPDAVESIERDKKTTVRTEN